MAAGGLLAAVEQMMEGTIANGFAIEGAGVWVGDATPTIRHCTFLDCFADICGGAAYINGGLASFENCTFQGNHAFNGGGAQTQSWARRLSGTSVRERTMRSAAARASAVTVLVTAIHVKPPARAAWTPFGASSITTHRLGRIPILLAARRNSSGSGFFALTSDPVM